MCLIGETVHEFYTTGEKWLAVKKLGENSEENTWS
jgi:hypothetical protein